MKAIVAHNVSKVYPNGVVGNYKINVEIENGEIFTFLGPNGAGKTTFVRMITTELRPTSGQIFVMGYDVLKSPLEIKKIIGVVPQDASPFLDLTVQEHVYYITRLRGFSKDQALVMAKKAIEANGLVEYKTRIVSTLSDGLKKRVLIASALAHEPDILVLDEPTAGLDPVARKNMLMYLEQQKRRGTTIIFTTHYVEEAEKLADRIGILKNGRLVIIGSPKELITSTRYRHKLIIYGSDAIFSKLEKALKLTKENIEIEKTNDSIELRFSEISEESLLELYRFVKQNNLRFVFSHVSLEDIYIKIIEG
ncbi:MAG: ABC transporter ATP-binding protein [Brevinematia bacterium]|jgi:ABC-type multidrug transport system ATPase subunit